MKDLNFRDRSTSLKAKAMLKIDKQFNEIEESNILERKVSEKKAFFR